MNLKTFVEEHKGIRRTVLGICIAWVSVTIPAGLWIMLDRSLSGPDAAFLTAIVALMQVPIGFYFYHRGKQ